MWFDLEKILRILTLNCSSLKLLSYFLKGNNHLWFTFSLKLSLIPLCLTSSFPPVFSETQIQMCITRTPCCVPCWVGWVVEGFRRDLSAPIGFWIIPHPFLLPYPSVLRLSLPTQSIHCVYVCLCVCEAFSVFDMCSNASGHGLHWIWFLWCVSGR